MDNKSLSLDIVENGVKRLADYEAIRLHQDFLKLLPKYMGVIDSINLSQALKGRLDFNISVWDFLHSQEFENIFIIECKKEIKTKLQFEALGILRASLDKKRKSKKSFLGRLINL